MIIVNDKVEHRTNGYEIAIRYIERKGYSLVDPQEIAQTEFEQYLENLQSEETIDDYLFHDDLCLERGSGRDKLPQLLTSVNY